MPILLLLVLLLLFPPRLLIKPTGGKTMAKHFSISCDSVFVDCVTANDSLHQRIGVCGSCTSHPLSHTNTRWLPKTFILIHAWKAIIAVEFNFLHLQYLNSRFAFVKCSICECQCSHFKSITNSLHLKCYTWNEIYPSTKDSFQFLHGNPLHVSISSQGSRSNHFIENVPQFKW